MSKADFLSHDIGSINQQKISSVIKNSLAECVYTLSIKVTVWVAMINSFYDRLIDAENSCHDRLIGAEYSCNNRPIYAEN